MIIMGIYRYTMLYPLIINNSSGRNSGQMQFGMMKKSGFYVDDYWICWNMMEHAHYDGDG